MVVAAVALVTEKKCSNWCTDKLSATPSVLSMVAATAAWAHITAAADCAQRATVVDRGKLLPPSPAPVPDAPLPVVPMLLPLLPRTHEAGPPPLIMLMLKSCAPWAPLSGPRLTASQLVPRLLPAPSRCRQSC
jgi:hypothetical protein